MKSEEELAWLRDNELREAILYAIRQARALNDGICFTPLRQKIDDYLTRAFLLVRDGHEKNINGGQ